MPSSLLAASTVAMLLLLLLLSDAHGSDAKTIQVTLNRMPRTRDAALLLSRSRLADENDANRSLTASENDRNAEHQHADAAETRIYSGEGSHTIRVSVGGQLRELIIDTGSGKTAFICEGCQNCGDAHLNAPFKFTSETKYLTCDLSEGPSATTASSFLSFIKSPLQQHMPSTCMRCVDSKCEYSQAYVEGDYWVAYKVSDVMQLAQNEPNFRSSVAFGCIFKQNGVFNLQSSDGIMGFSRHPDSIFEQFYRNKVTKSRIFSQCLGTQGGMLTLGGVDLSINYDTVQYTPVRDTGYQYWTVTLLSVEVGGVPMQVDSAVYNRDRGCVFDSGTTFLYMPAVTKEAFKAAWRSAVGNDKFPISSRYYSLSEHEVAQFPSVCFFFLNNAKVCMSPKMYFFRNSPGRYVGTIFFGDDAKSTIIGASALTDYNVIYDIDNARIGVARANCEASVGSADSAARVELSLSPGGETFRSVVSPFGDPTTAAQLLLAAATFFGVVGLVNVLWMEIKSVKAERARLAGDEKQQPRKEGCTSDNKDAPTSSLSFGSLALSLVDHHRDDHDDDDVASAFSFILMHDDDKEQAQRD